MASRSAPPQSVHDFTVDDIKGNDVDLSIYKRKVLVIVNVASQWFGDIGISMQSVRLTRAWHQGRIKSLLALASRPSIPFFDKLDVNGANCPNIQVLKSSKGSLLGDGIEWNFAKFLVDKEGHVVDRYLPTTFPLAWR